MSATNECPTCGGEVEKKMVERLLRGGTNTAVLSVRAEVCTRCGKHLYSKTNIARFKEIREKLLKQEIAGFKLLGQSFQVV